MKQVPKLTDLHMKPEEAFKNDQLNLLLNEEPPVSWLKTHPMVAKLKYLPIDKVEFLLTRIFQRWYVEILDYKSIFNSIAVSVRLHYFNPYLKSEGEWMWMDGVGAAPAQTEKEAKAFDLTSIKSAAVQIGLPAAESYAFKDAAEKIGRLFGKDLNRKDVMAFAGAFAEVPEEKKEQQLTDGNNNQSYNYNDLQL